MPPTTTPPRVRRALALVLGAVVVVSLLGGLALLGLPAPLSSPVERPRAFGSSGLGSLPTGAGAPRVDLGATPPPAFVRELGPDRVRHSWPAGLTLERDFDRYLSLVRADPTLTAVLASGGTTLEVRVVARALCLGRDAEGGGVEFEWRDARSGEPRTSPLEASSEEVARANGKLPCAVFVLELAGAPCRLLGFDLYDAVTGWKVNRGAMWWQPREDLAVVAFDLPLRHRTPLVLTARIAHGAPSIARVPLVVGTTATVGRFDRLEVLATGPGSPSSWSEGSSQDELVWQTPALVAGQHFAALAVWPPSAAFLQYHAGGGHWSAFTEAGTLASAVALAASTEALEVRAFPLASLVRFDLPAPQELAAVSNLFDVRFEEVDVEDRHSLVVLLQGAVQARPGSLDFLELPPTAFPLRRADVSIGELVEELGVLRGAPIGFDREALGFTPARASLGNAMWRSFRAVLPPW